METMYKAFWDHLKVQLSNTPADFTGALELSPVAVSRDSSLVAVRGLLDVQAQ